MCFARAARDSLVTCGVRAAQRGGVTERRMLLGMHVRC